jgi:hypothetical protein
MVISFKRHARIPVYKTISGDMYHEDDREDKTHEMQGRLRTLNQKRNIVLLPISLFYYIHRLDGNFCNPASSGAQHNQRP